MHGGITMPYGAQILSVQLQGGEPTLWAIVDTTRPTEERFFIIRMTGEAIPPEHPRGIYLATLQFQNDVVGHVFAIDELLT
jgi:hypothetical protein